ncbi:hypothetical protein HY622_02030 [Candidatus Uhrbacteria bacterium]|nr:hypothetical protein [Candidatus Uhrbacteria bacterium]
MKVIRDADVERLEAEHRVCELHKIYATSAFVQQRFAASNIIVVAKIGWYEFSEGRLEMVWAQSAKALARELTRRLRGGIYFPSRCEYREETEGGWFLQSIHMENKGDVAYTLRYHLKDAKLSEDSPDPAIAGRAEIRKAIESYAASIAPALKKRWLVEVKGGWCDAAGVLWRFLAEEAIEPAKLGLSQAEARKLEDLARR